MKATDFLDIYLDLNTGKTSPFRKPLHTPTYVHSQSSHPSNILKQIPQLVQDRISRLSSSEAEFNNAAPPYNEALRAAGYKEKMTFKKPTQNQGQNKRKRRRKFLYFNPPFSAAVQSNVTKMFFAIIDRCFPRTHPYLGKLFNRRTFKVSYCTTRNVDAIISSHNTKILNSDSRAADDITSRARAQYLSHIHI